MFILEKQFCVYVDFIKKDGEFIPGYVGKGNKNRVGGMGRNQHHEDIAKNHEWKRVVVAQDDDEDLMLNVVEPLLIRELHTWAYDPEKTRYACNYTLGGEGVSGYKYTQEQKDANSRRVSKRWYEYWQDDEMRETLRNAQKEGNKSPEVKENRHNAMLDVHNRPEVVVSKSVKMIEYCIKPGVFEQRSMKQKEAKSKSEYKEKVTGKNNYMATAVEKYDLEDNHTIETFDTMGDAIKNCEKTTVPLVCKGRLRSAGGFGWRYVDPIKQEKYKQEPRSQQFWGIERKNVSTTNT